MSGGRFDFDDGGSYTGGWENGKAHGLGCCTGPKGKGEYNGQWHYGFELLGVYTWPSGNCYEGHWENGRRNGSGVETKGRWVYRGDWSQGYKGRYGVRQSLNSGAKYEGTWSSGLQDGYGQETYADGGTFQGQWVGGMRHGYGIRNSVPYNMAAIIRPNLRSSLTSLRSEHETSSSIMPSVNGSLTSADGFGHRGGFVLNVEPASEPLHKGILQRTGSLRRTLMQGLRLRKSDRRSRSTANSQVSQTSSRSHSSSRARSLPHQDSLRSTTSTLSSGSAPSSLYGDDVSYLNEEPEGDLTEVYMGEWKQDKRAGYGISQRSDGLKYEGEWQNNRKHGYGVTTRHDGSREEGKWKNNQLVASGKKKIFPLRSAKISDRVVRAVDFANQAAELARQKADIGVSRASHARDKAQAADVTAIQAREDANRAKLYAKDLSHSPAGSDTNIKLERKKSFFNQIDRRNNKPIGVTTRSPIGNQLQLPTHTGENNNQEYYESLRRQQLHESGISSAADVSPSGSPMRSRRSPIEKSHSSDRMGDSHNDHHYYRQQQYDRGRRIPDRLHLDGPIPQQHSYHFDSMDKDYDDRYYSDSQYDHPRDSHMRYGRHDRSSAELTPDSGVSTLSESERSRTHRKDYTDQRGKLQRRSTFQRQQKFEDEHGEEQQQQQRHHESGARVTIKEPDPETDMNDIDDFPLLEDEEEDTTEKKKKKNKNKSKYAELTIKSDKPPGHYRSLTGRFPDGCGITYIPKGDENEDGIRDPDLDPEAVMVVRGKNVEWSASGKMVALVLFLNLGFTVLFSQLFTQIQEMPDF